MQRLPFVTYRGQTNRIIYLHENTRNERLMQKKTPITDPLCRSVQYLRPFLIVRPKTLTRDRQNGNLWGEPFHQCESPDPLVAPSRGYNKISLTVIWSPKKDSQARASERLRLSCLDNRENGGFPHFFAILVVFWDECCGGQNTLLKIMKLRILTANRPG